MFFKKRKNEEAVFQEIGQQIQERIGQQIEEQMVQRMEHQLSGFSQNMKKQQMAVENLTDEWADYREEWQDFREEENCRKELLEAAAKQEEAFLELYETCQEQLDNLKKYAGAEDEKLLAQMDFIEEKLEKSRQKCGIGRIASVGGKVDYDLQEVVHVIETENPDLSETVAKVYVSGYYYKGKIQKKAKIAAYRFSQGR